MKGTKENFFKRVGFVSLGCDKNRVDTENVISVLSRHSCFEFVWDKSKAQIIIVNTCAFLKVAREEARDVILEMGKLKEKGNLEKLIVMGCLPMLNREDVQREFPFVDLVLTPNEYFEIDKKIFALFGEKFLENDKKDIGRMITTPLHYAYLKIADGCNNRCAFCKIPFIRGNYKSVPIDDLVSEATILAERGVKEIVLVAQDLTRYGCDIHTNLVELLRKLGEIKKLSWIRLLYCYPEKVTAELIEEIKNNPKVVKYIDIPLQHISSNVLAGMKRRNTKQDTVSLVKTLRKEVKGIKIRSTFMVGFPGETEKDFLELCNFLKKFKLENVGFFKYSREEGTSSFDLEGQIEEKVKDERLKIVQDLQTKIANRQNKKLKGKVFKVLVDEFDKKHKFFVGRAYFSAPDIDFEILIEFSKKISVGSFVDVKIVDFVDGYFIGKVS